MPTPLSLKRSPLNRRLRAVAGPAAGFALGLVDPWRRPVDRDAQPIFIAGCPHSGTTLLLRQMGQHPAIHAVPYESNIFCTPRTRRAHVGSYRAWRRDVADAGKSRLCEKTPNHVFHLDRMLRLYPSARVLVALRDGRDVAVSLAKRWNGDIERAIRTWADAVEASAPWLADERVHVVRYEQLVQATEATLTAACAHVGERFDPAMLDEGKAFHYLGVDRLERPPTVVGQDHDQFRVWQVNQPLFDGSGVWRTSLSPEQIEICRRVAGPALAVAGYAEPGW